jgi:hypothetical protein
MIALGSETGRRTDHVHLGTLSLSLNAFANFAFLFPFAFALFRAPAPRCYPPPSNATRPSSRSNCHHVAHATIAAAPSEHAAKHTTSPLLPHNAH